MTSNIHASTEYWTKNDITVTLTPGTDEHSGMKETLYAYGDHHWTAYREEYPFTVNQVGETMIQAKSIDQVGYESIQSELVVKIDKTPPKIQFDIDGNNLADQQTTVTTAVYVSNDCNGANACSGLDFPSLDASDLVDWITFKNNDTLSHEGDDGEWYLHIRASDLAGNSRFRSEYGTIHFKCRQSTGSRHDYAND